MTFELWLTIGGVASVFGCVSAFDKYEDMDNTAMRAAVIMLFGALLGPLSIPVAFAMAYRRYCEHLADEQRKFELEQKAKSQLEQKAKSLPYKTDGEAP